MGLVVEADCAFGSNFAERFSSGLPSGGWYFQQDVYVPSSTLTALDGDGDTRTARLCTITDWVDTLNDDGLSLKKIAGVWTWTNDLHGTSNGAFVADAWHTIAWHWTGSVGGQATWTVDGVEIFNYSDLGSNFFTTVRFQVGGIQANGVSGEVYRVDNVRIGTTLGGFEIFCDDFQDGTVDAWDSGPPVVTFSPDAPTGDCVALGVDFVGAPLSGHVPFTVAFTDLTTGSPSAWLWDFGDGDTSTLQHPDHEYATPGVYDVTLTAT